MRCSSSSRPRRGVTSVMAMIFSVLFGTLAIGFYAATTTQVQVSNNDQRVFLAQTAAESGLDFMRYQLAQVSIPPNTPANQVVNSLYTNLQNQLNGTSNMGANTVTLSNNVIYVSGNGAINIDSAHTQTFSATITTWGAGIVVKTTGTYKSANGSTINRGVTMDFTLQPLPTTSFNFAVASAGQVVVSKSALTGVTGVPSTVATVMSNSVSAGSVTVSGGSVGGDLDVRSGATAVYTSGSVGGVSNNTLIQSSHVHIVPAQDFPVVDTTIFRSYATKTWVSGAATQQNIYVPPNSNPQFNGGDTVQGILYVASPNKVTFRGNFNLNGFIVFEQNASAGADSMSFSGNVTTSPLPAGSQFDSLRAVSGVAILAPTASVTMSGSANSYVRGNIIVNVFTMSGASILQIDQGTLMTLSTGLKSAWLNGSKQIQFSSTGQNNQPSQGVSYNQYFAPNQSTYQEIMP